MGYGSLAGSIYGREIRGVRSSGRVLDHPAVKRIAATLACSEAQVLIQWGLLKGAVCIPKTADPSRLCANANAASVVKRPASRRKKKKRRAVDAPFFSQALTADHVAALDGLRDASLGTAAILKEIDGQGSNAFVVTFLRLQLAKVVSACVRFVITCVYNFAFNYVRLWLKILSPCSHWCRARSIQVEAFFVDDLAGLLARLRNSDPLPLAADAEVAKSVGGLAVIDLDFGRVLRAVDPAMRVGDSNGGRLLDLLRMPEYSATLDAALRAALSAGGMRDLDAYVLWDLRVVQSPGAALIHWDRQRVPPASRGLSSRVPGASLFLGTATRPRRPRSSSGSPSS